jgi:hypothetical protein
MSAVIDSKMQMLDEDEIIGIAAQETNSPYSPEQIKAAILTEVNQLDALIIREGNTFFIVDPTNNPKVAQIRALNADTARNFIENGIKVAKALSEKGMTTLYTDFEDDSVIQILRAIGAGMGETGFGTGGSGFQVRRLKSGKMRAVINMTGWVESSKGGLSSVEEPLE